MRNTAKLSKCRKYRYALWRTWHESKPYIMFVGLNPSTVDETIDDPTLTRCINYALPQIKQIQGACTSPLSGG